MAEATSKFTIGDTVWTATAVDEPVYAVCPDCNDTKVWAAQSPAGDKFDFACPRCQGQESWKLRHNKAVAVLRKLTIGSIQIDTADAERPVSYMCNETGVGSGTIWSQDRLAADEEGAKEIGRAAVVERELWRITQLDRLERNSGGPDIQGRLKVAVRYQPWSTAAMTEAKTEAWQIGYKLENLCNAIAELDDYGGIEGLDAPTLERIITHLADTYPPVREHREAVLFDRGKARKAAA